MSLRQELNELVDVLLVANPDLSAVRQVELIAHEAVDVVCVAIASVDEDNKAADIAQLRLEATEFAQELAAKIEIPFGMGIVVPVVAGALIDQLAAYSGPIESFKDQYLVPFFAGFKAFGERGLQKLLPESER